MNTLSSEAPANSSTDSGEWHAVGSIEQFPVNAGIAVKIGATQIAIYRMRNHNAIVEGTATADADQWYACANQCPHRQENVLARGLVGDHASELMVACPLHKKAFSLKTGACLNDPDYRVPVYAIEIRENKVFVQY